jgi:hypothetical protein
MKTSVQLDEETVNELRRTASIVREDPSTVLRMAIRAGLPIIADRFQPQRPDGFFATDYQTTRPEQAELEEAFSKIPIFPDR